MSTRPLHSFSVLYRETMLHDAVRAYVWRRLVLEQKRLWISASVMAGIAVALLVGGRSPIMVWVAAGFALLPVLLTAIGWWAHRANTLDSFRRMNPKRADFTFTADEMQMESPLGRGALPWATLTEVWEMPTYWMIFTGKTRFNVLPKADLPEDAQRFFRDRNRAILTPG